MPKRKTVTTDSKSSKSDKTEFKGFINVRLRKEEVKHLEAWQEANADKVLFMLAELAENGYLVSVRRDKDTDAFICTVNGFFTDCPDYHAGYILSARASSQQSALWQALYWHYEISEQGPWDFGADLF